MSDPTPEEIDKALEWIISLGAVPTAEDIARLGADQYEAGRREAEKSATQCDGCDREWALEEDGYCAGCLNAAELTGFEAGRRAQHRASMGEVASELTAIRDALRKRGMSERFDYVFTEISRIAAGDPPEVER